MSSFGQITDKNYWDKRWQQFCRIYKISKYDKMWGPKGSFMRIMRRYTGNMEGIKIIELGGAASYFSLVFAKWGGANVKLIDYSSVGLEKTREIYTLNGCAIETIEDDFLSWDQGDEQFDLVVHCGLMEHFTDPLILCKRLISRCVEKIKPRHDSLHRTGAHVSPT